jgi:isocitrate dehydrogenase
VTESARVTAFDNQHGTAEQYIKEGKNRVNAIPP